MRLQICCQDYIKFTRSLINLLEEQTLALPDIKPQARDMLLLNFTNLPSRQEKPLISALGALPGVVMVKRQQEPTGSAAFQQIIATDEKMCAVLEQARKMAQLNAPLLIVGDTGTGKDFLAHACHKASPRADQPYLAINCAAIPEDVVESELFGHAPGAYPNALEGKKGFFEQANGGSVLLDEIGEMSPQMQVRLLRFLNDGIFRRVGEDLEVHVDVRIICATQKNLQSLVHKGHFREDLYYRLNVLTLELPTLNQRPQDIMPLAKHFLADFAEEQAVSCPRISAELSRLLINYRWPGNVRQLKNTLHRAFTQLSGNVLRPQDVILPEFEEHGGQITHENLTGSLEEMTRRFERSVLLHLYKDFPSSRKLAGRLGISHTAIANKLRDYGISRAKKRSYLAEKAEETKK